MKDRNIVEIWYFNEDNYLLGTNSPNDQVFRLNIIINFHLLIIKIGVNH